jgi:hypothetical protein
MGIRLFTWFSCFILLSVFIYSCDGIQLIKAQTPSWKTYLDSGHKFSFSYPSDWQVKSRHDNVTGSSEVTLSKPNSTRTQVSLLYNSNDTLLVNSKTGKTIVPSKALTNLEKQIGTDYVFFNATGKFPHKYKIQNHQSASDIVDYEKSAGKPGKMLIVLAKASDRDSCTVIYSESKRLFYKNLYNVSEIIKSIQITS